MKKKKKIYLAPVAEAYLEEEEKEKEFISITI